MFHSRDEFLNDVFLTLQNYIHESADNHPVIKVCPVEKIKELLPSISSDGVSEDALLKEIEVILDHSVKTIHPMFLNQLFGGFDKTAWVGEVIASLSNPTMATFEIAPVLTVIEKKVVLELLKMMGFDRGEGVMVTGGSNSNLLAMLCART